MFVFAEEFALCSLFLQVWLFNLPAVSPSGIPSLPLWTVSNRLHQCWLSRVQPCRWGRTFAIWPSYLQHLLCHPYQELVAAAECLSVVASGPNCWTSTLALPTAPCHPTTPSSSRNQVGGPPTQWMTLTVDSGPSQCTSQASLQARAPVELGPSESRLQVNQGCVPMEPACPAVWTVLPHQGTRVSMLSTSPTSLHPISVLSHWINVCVFTHQSIKSKF